MVGYDDTSPSYLIYDIEKGKIAKIRDAYFQEDSFPGACLPGLRDVKGQLQQTASAKEGWESDKQEILARHDLQKQRLRKKLCFLAVAQFIRVVLHY